MTAGRRVKLRPGLTSEILDLVLDLGFWGSDREGKCQDILTADSEKKAQRTQYSNNFTAGALSCSVKKKVGYSQKKWISVKKSQGKVKKKSKKLTFP